MKGYGGFVKAVIASEVRNGFFNDDFFGTPKILLPLLGKPLLGYMTDMLSFYGMNEIVLLLDAQSEKVSEYLKNNDSLPTALFASNDAVAVGVIRGLKEAGYEVPKDISIIAFNDTIVSQYTNPPLTSVSVHTEYLGEVAVELMVEKLSNDRRYAKKVIVPSEFVIRESVKRII